MPLYLLISGYGPFLDIKHNPADELGQLIADQFESTFQTTNIKLLTYVSLAVEPGAVDQMVQKWSQEIDSIRKSDPSARF